MSSATTLLIQDNNERYFVVDVKILNSNKNTDENQQQSASSNGGVGGYQSASSNTNRITFDDDYSVNNESSTDAMPATALPFSIANLNSKKQLRYFTFQALRYSWNETSRSYKKIRGYDFNTPCVDLLQSFHGFTTQNQATL